MAEEGFTKETIDELDDARDIENLKRVEAALFVSGRFLSTQELVALTDLNPILLNSALEKLSEKYDDKSAIEIINNGDLWKMDVKVEHKTIVNKLATGSNEFSRAEQETLAVIAHKSPIMQSKVIKTRGNKAYEHIKRFVEVGLLKSKKAGRSRELSLSEGFYDYFSLGKKEKIFNSSENNKSEEGE